MTTKDTITDLCERMHLLHMRNVIVFHESGTGPIGNIPYIPLAEALARGLLADDKDAVATAHAVVGMNDLFRADFWVTPLGRLLFQAGGYPGDSCTQTVAAAAMGCTRQYVHALVKSGQIRSQAGINPAAREVNVVDVRDLLKTKLDRLVK